MDCWIKKIGFKMKSPKNSIMRWLVFLRFFFPELSKTIQILFLLQLVLFFVSKALLFLHLDRLNIDGIQCGLHCCLPTQLQENLQARIPYQQMPCAVLVLSRSFFCGEYCTYLELS